MHIKTTGCCLHAIVPQLAACERRVTSPLLVAVFLDAMVVAVGDEQVAVGGEGDTSRLTERLASTLDHAPPHAAHAEELYTLVAAVDHGDDVTVGGDAERLSELTARAARASELITEAAERTKYLPCNNDSEWFWF